MTNSNYNLLKLLHNTLDDLWRLEKFYIKDAGEEGCETCLEILKSIRTDIEKHTAALQGELAVHVRDERFK